MINFPKRAIGAVQVEVISADYDKPLDGWRAKDCEPFIGDELNKTICWCNKSLSDLNGTLVRLRFQLKDATLYSFDIR